MSGAMLFGDARIRASFWELSAVNLRTGCWEWSGYRDRRGYARLGTSSAHRLAYEAARGPIPDGMTVDHLCFTPRCVNPDHLRLLTHLENSRNQRSASKTHCVNGHEFSPENTYIRPRRANGGTRDCRTCIRDRQSRAIAKRKAKVA